MKKQLHSMAFGHWGMLVVLLSCAILPVSVFGAAKDYPLEGTVTALGTTSDTGGGGNMPVLTHTYRTYTVKTPSRILVLQCPYSLESLLPPHECGGKKKIAIGDTIHFRAHKRHAYVQTDEGKEQRLAILSEAVDEESPRAVQP